MKTLTKVQNDLAIKEGYKNIAELMEESVRKGNVLQILTDLDKICVLVQQEQQKLIASKITIGSTINKIQSSILNENNITR